MFYKHANILFITPITTFFSIFRKGPKMKTIGILFARQILPEVIMSSRPYIKGLKLLAVTFFAYCAFQSTVVLADGDSSGGDNSGGGDTFCEARFKDIRNDFAQWLTKNGPELRHLDLSAVVPKMSYAKFTEKVMPWVAEGALIVSCVNPEKIDSPKEKELADKLTFYGSKKICMFEQHEDFTQVICDSRKMRPLASYEDYLAGAQYEQTIHEILGAAGIEAPSNKDHKEDSSYPVSRQFKSFLGYVTIKKLTLESVEDGHDLPIDYYGGSKLVSCDHTLPKSAVCELTISGYEKEINTQITVNLFPIKDQDSSIGPKETRGRARLDIEHSRYPELGPDYGFAIIDLITIQETHGQNPNGCQLQTWAKGALSYNNLQLKGLKLNYDSDENSITMKCELN